MRHRQIRLLHRLLSRFGIRVLKRVEMLHQSNDSITSLGKGILLWNHLLLAYQSRKELVGKKLLTAKANTRSTIEWKVLPSSPGILFPTLWSEGVRIGAVEVGSSVHGIDAVCNDAAFSDVDRGPLAWSASYWEGSVLVCDTEVKRNWRLQAEGCTLSVTHDYGY